MLFFKSFIQDEDKDQLRFLLEKVKHRRSCKGLPLLDRCVAWVVTTLLHDKLEERQNRCDALDKVMALSEETGKELADELGLLEMDETKWVDEQKWEPGEPFVPISVSDVRKLIEPYVKYLNFKENESFNLCIDLLKEETITDSLRISVWCGLLRIHHDAEKERHWRENNLLQILENFVKGYRGHEKLICRTLLAKAYLKIFNNPNTTERYLDDVHSDDPEYVEDNSLFFELKGECCMRTAEKISAKKSRASRGKRKKLFLEAIENFKLAQKAAGEEVPDKLLGFIARCKAQIGKKEEALGELNDALRRAEGHGVRRHALALQERANFFYFVESCPKKAVEDAELGIEKLMEIEKSGSKEPNVLILKLRRSIIKFLKKKPSATYQHWKAMKHSWIIIRFLKGVDCLEELSLLECEYQSRIDGRRELPFLTDPWEAKMNLSEVFIYRLLHLQSEGQNEETWEEIWEKICENLLDISQAYRGDEAALADVARYCVLCKKLLQRTVPCEMNDNLAPYVEARENFEKLGNDAILWRAEYGGSKKTLHDQGLQARDPEADLDWRAHVEDGEQKTQFISFSKSQQVATMYWIKCFKQGEGKRILLGFDCSNWRFRVKKCIVEETSTREQRGRNDLAQARKKVDREILLVPAGGSLHHSVIKHYIDLSKRYETNEKFKNLVDETPKRPGYNKFASSYLDILEDFSFSDVTYSENEVKEKIESWAVE